MTYSKIFKTILFLLAFIATLLIGLVFRTEFFIQNVKAVEPVTVVKRIEVPIEETEAVDEPNARVISETPVLQPRIECPLSDGLQQTILELCMEYDVDFALTMAVIYRESSFRTNIVSADGGDYGLMQINKINHNWLSETLGITDFLDPEQNVTAGLYMLSNLFKKYDNPAQVLMAYNMGESGARRLWKQGIYSTDYAEDILQQADIYNAEIAERMGENVLHR